MTKIVIKKTHYTVKSVKIGIDGKIFGRFCYTFTNQNDVTSKNAHVKSYGGLKFWKYEFTKIKIFHSMSYLTLNMHIYF